MQQLLKSLRKSGQSELLEWENTSASNELTASFPRTTGGQMLRTSLCTPILRAHVWEMSASACVYRDHHMAWVLQWDTCTLGDRLFHWGGGGGGCLLVLGLGVCLKCVISYIDVSSTKYYSTNCFKSSQFWILQHSCTLTCLFWDIKFLTKFKTRVP
jgi:hypothetical protein